MKWRYQIVINNYQNSAQLFDAGQSSIFIASLTIKLSML